MDKIETVFIEDNVQPVIKLEPLADFEANVGTGERHEKIGEIFRSKANAFLFVCSHCGITFSLYPQFVAHAEVHLQQFLLQTILSDRNISNEQDAKPLADAAADDIGDIPDCARYNADWPDDQTAGIKSEIDQTGRSDFTAATTTRPSGEPSNLRECKICKKKVLAQSLRLHIKYLHTRQMGAACPICDQKFSIQRYVYPHMQRRHKTKFGYRCDKCESKFQFVQDLRQHQQTHRCSSPVLERLYECHQCHQTFDTLPQCYNHMTHGHWQRPASAVKSIGKPIAKCTHCKERFESKEILEKHQRHCGAVIKDKLQCDMCNKAFRYKWKLQQHRRDDHETGQRTYKCPGCAEELLTYRMVQCHMARHRRQERIANNDLLKCPVCAREFAGRSELNTHITSHNEDAKFECEICHKTLRLSTKKNHMLRHANKKDHQCAQCGSRFVTVWALNHHMITHSDERAHQCGRCAKKFKTASALKIHMESHTGDYKYKCKLCSYGASWRASLKKHSLAVHGKPLEDDATVARFAALTKKKSDELLMDNQ